MKYPITIKLKNGEKRTSFIDSLDELNDLTYIGKTSINSLPFLILKDNNQNLRDSVELQQRSYDLLETEYFGDSVTLRKQKTFDLIRIINADLGYETPPLD